jgi:NAD(P)-dependent dehydrogenase (short-subunit alcohol dehydrogenase family)
MANFGDFPLLGKIAVVTGAGSGINLAFTRLAVNSGARVIMADIHLTSEAEQFLKSTKNAIFQRCDVTKWGDLEHLVTVSKNEFEDVPDVYVAGAGVFEPVTCPLFLLNLCADNSCSTTILY